jgi:hypothetical protein
MRRRISGMISELRLALMLSISPYMLPVVSTRKNTSATWMFVPNSRARSSTGPCGGRIR